ncbi:stamen-specific protein FIL1-like [Salvia divinorum]|uniref:Stamen-specific protein FIL1-like n=1 Tax=Salvia divinorum TaxID=28513 RepID=A0ABD1H3E1_SALDI
MEIVKCIYVVVLVVGVMSGSWAQPQSTCSSALSTLNVCTPFVVPGAVGNPSSDCCGALQSIDRDCLCSTLRVASRIPAQCNLPPFTCPSELDSIYQSHHCVLLQLPLQLIFPVQVN